MSEATQSGQPSPPSRSSRARRSPARYGVWVAVAAVCLLAAVALWRILADAPATRRGAGTRRAAPVVADSARIRDFDVHLAALGTVTPLRSVTVRSRVDGQLQSVHFREGQTVASGQLLAVLDPRPFEAQVQQARAQVARDSALLVDAQLDLARDLKLLEQDYVPQQQVDTQRALVGQYEAQVRLDQAALRSAALQLTYSRITAEFPGRVGLRLVDPGNIVHATDAGGLTVITQLRPISVLFSVPRGSLPGLSRRMQSRQPLPVTLYDSDGTTRLAEGRVVTIDNQIDPATGTVKVRAEFANDDQRLFPNQFVNVQVLVQRIAGAVVVPSAAVQRGAVGTFAYLVRPDSTVTVRPLAVGPSEGDFAVITQGLSAGEAVVVDGVDQLREGMSVRLMHPGRPAGPAGRTGAGQTRSGGRGGGDGATRRAGARPTRA